MSLVAQKAPDFTAEAVLADNSITRISLSDYLGKYVVLFFYPLDFTFVCPTEILAFDRKLEEFKKRNTEVIGVSVDSAVCHLAWKNTLPEKGGIGQINYPLVADLNKQIAKTYDVLTADGTVALRGLFLIDRDGVIQHAMVNNDQLGRSTDEVIRLLDALQFQEKNGQVCPANWHKGDSGLTPSSEGIASYLAKNSV